MLADTIHLLGCAFSLGHEAVQQNGTDFQIDMAIEECGELIVALQHHKRGRPNSTPEEIADVMIMMMVLLRVFGTKHINTTLKAKLDRMRERLE